MTAPTIEAGDPLRGVREALTRRHFLRAGSHLLGGAALTQLAAGRGLSEGAIGPHFAPKAKRVIYLHMVGGPPQMDLFDPKPGMVDWFDKDLPESIRNGQRLTTMTSGQARFPIAPSRFRFDRYGESGMDLCELLPNLGKTVDKMCFVRTVHTDAINHEPAITFLQTGNQITGRPCLGAWASYGLGTEAEDLPSYVVIHGGQVPSGGMQMFGSGFLPSTHQPSTFLTSKPVLANILPR